MSATPREIGTLIVVVLKANHLPNKRHIGKQDPYCVVEVNGEKRRTKAIRRGGQHPEWDEEIRFTLFEDVCDILDRSANGSRTPPPLPPKDEKESRKIKGGKIMRLACFADDAREPDLIGEASVDLTEVLTKGETDEWFTLNHKDKFAGKVYLELTFWSNAPPPEKKTTPKPAKNMQYAGPGSFVPSGDPSANGTSQTSRIVSASSLLEHSRQNSDTIPGSLRPSSSLAKLDLYAPPYEQKSYFSAVDQVANEFQEFGVSDHNRRRESFPPPRGGHTPRPSSPSGYSTFRSHVSGGYNQSISDGASVYSYDQPQGQSPQHHRLPPHYPSHSGYQSTYEHQSSAYHHQGPTHRGPRHSIPTTSSGFIPLAPPSDAAGFSPSTLGYSAHQPTSQPVYASQIPTSTSVDAYLASVPSSSFIPQQSFPQSQSFNYIQNLSTTPIPQSYTPVPAAATQAYLGFFTTPSPSHDGGVPLPSSISLPSSLAVASRPLPQQPQVIYAQQVSGSYSIPPPNSLHQPINSFNPANSVYQPPPPPPPPPPPLQHPVDQPSQQTFTSSGHTVNGFPPPPPPPPPPQLFLGTSSQRESSLPPVPHDQHAATVPSTPSPPQNVPPPRSRRQSTLPQPPVMYQSTLPPASEFLGQTPLPPPPPPQLPYHPGPPPNPPAQIDRQGQWSSAQSGPTGYISQSHTY